MNPVSYFFIFSILEIILLFGILYQFQKLIEETSGLKNKSSSAANVRLAHYRQDEKSESPHTITSGLLCGDCTNHQKSMVSSLENASINLGLKSRLISLNWNRS